jgi:hypothetical protein
MGWRARRALGAPVRQRTSRTPVARRRHSPTLATSRPRIGYPRIGSGRQASAREGDREAARDELDAVNAGFGQAFATQDAELLAAQWSRGFSC